MKLLLLAAANGSVIETTLAGVKLLWLLLLLVARRWVRRGLVFFVLVRRFAIDVSDSYANGTGSTERKTGIL